MIEGQEGLSWDRWRRICQDADRLGFASLRRSDHFVSLNGRPELDCIECWISLALAAEWTKTIEFGPMVSPMTFRPPALLARMAAAVDVLAGGRLILGVGAGWNEPEHTEFKIHFPTQPERFDMLEAGIQTIRDSWQKSNPKPARNPIPLLIGGKGAKRTLPLVAREASEWNLSRLDADLYRQLFFQAEDGIRDTSVTGVQTCALPISTQPFRLLFESTQRNGALRRRACGLKASFGVFRRTRIYLGHYLFLLFVSGVSLATATPQIGRASCRKECRCWWSPVPENEEILI